MVARGLVLAACALISNGPPATEIYTLSLHDALPIWRVLDHQELLRRHAQLFRCEDIYLRVGRSEEHTSELQSQSNLVCRLLLEKKTHRSSSPRPRRPAAPGRPPRTSRRASRRARSAP